MQDKGTGKPINMDTAMIRKTDPMQDKELDSILEYLTEDVDPERARVISKYGKAQLVAWRDKRDSLLQKAVDMSGNEFAMGYNDSGCFWSFYAGARGAGNMMGQPVFSSESPEPLEALQEYIAHLQRKEGEKHGESI
jgi:hypothetical protein